MPKTPLLSPAPTDKVQGMRQSHQLGPWPVNYISAAWLNHGMARSRSSTMCQAPGVTLPTSNSLGRHVYLRLKGPSKGRDRPASFEVGRVEMPRIRGRLPPDCNALFGFLRTTRPYLRANAA